MPLTIATTVGPQVLGDGVQAVGVRQGKEGQLIMSSLHATHYEQAHRGNVYMQTTTPLGLAIPIYTGTALAGGGLPIWNPPGSGVRVVPIFYTWGRSSGTSIASSVGILLRRLDSVATGQVMTALNETVPFNGHVFNGQVARAKSSNTGTNTVTAGAAGDFALQMGTMTAEIDTTANGPSFQQFLFHGVLSIPPGTLMYVAGSVASGALYAATMCWEEVPI